MDRSQSRAQEHNNLQTNEDETTALLASPTSTSPHEAETEDEIQKYRPWTTTLIFILMILLNIPSLLQSSAQVQIFENIYCNKYYDKHPELQPPSNGLCKIDDIQASVAILRGWRSFFNFLPGVFLCVPYGMLADKVGRKWVLVMNQVAINMGYLWVYLVCYFSEIIPIRFVWLEGIVGIFGGGNIVATALMFVVISDITPPRKIAVTFFRLSATNYLCFLISYSIAGKLMEFGPWLLYNIGIGLNFLTILVTLALPETLKKAQQNSPAEIGSVTVQAPALDVTRTSIESHATPTIPHKRSHNSLIKQIISIISSLQFLLDWRILFLGLSYPIREALNNLDELYFQYVPRRFGWSTAHTNYIYAFQAVGAMAVLLFVLPSLSSCLVGFMKFTTVQKEIFLARISISFYALGTLLIATASNIKWLLVAIAIQTCGSGMGGATRALMTDLVKADEVAKLYTFLGLVEAVSLMISAPLEAAIFNFGMHYGGLMWLGLPWFLMSMCLLFLALTFWILRLEFTISTK